MCAFCGQEEQILGINPPSSITTSYLVSFSKLFYKLLLLLLNEHSKTTFVSRSVNFMENVYNIIPISKPINIAYIHAMVSIFLSPNHIIRRAHKIRKVHWTIIFKLAILSSLFAFQTSTNTLWYENLQFVEFIPQHINGHALGNDHTHEVNISV